MPGPALVWFRQDLRLADNRALHAALEGGGPVLAVYVLEDGHRWAPGGAGRWWLHGSVAALQAALRARGGELVLRRGEPAEQLAAIAAETGAVALHAGQPHEPWARAALDAVAARLQPMGIPLHRHRNAQLVDYEAIRTQTGGVFGVYGAFARACRARGIDHEVLPAPERIPSPAPPRSDRLEKWDLLPTRPDWAGGLRDTWTPGEDGAAARLRGFMGEGVAGYHQSRNLPGAEGTSALSPHLHWGELSPRQVWRAAASAGDGKGIETYHNELLWREFSAYLLWHHPDLPDRPLRPEFDRMQWQHDRAALLAWRRGRTGIPLVDAGMRQLWQTGWMHNRIRMVTASFLIKHLLTDWREGEAWFWDTLVDADLASNAASWQWVAGCGADAAPFFRVFNPVLQGKKFDPDGLYVRRFVPELARLPLAHLHAPWEAPAAVLAEAGVVPGETYPHPVIGLAEGRARALETYRSVTGRDPHARR